MFVSRASGRVLPFVSSAAKGDIALNRPGAHNVYNALAGIAVGSELNIPFRVIKDALETVEGVGRRLEIKGHVHDDGRG